MATKKTHETEHDPWESKELGADERYVRVSSEESSQALDADLGLQQVTLRLQKELIAALKSVARDNGIGYQPLVRQILTKYIREHSPKGARVRP